MMKRSLPLLFTLLASSALAEGSRSHGAHEHGVGTLDIAVEGGAIAMAFHAPGADIVGFEHTAESDADHAAIDAAVELLEAPLELFVFPEAAECNVVDAHAALEGEEEHAHDHDDHAEEDHDHDEEAHEHEEHDHESHTEFHAEYNLTCAHPEAIDTLRFAYFEQFENALEVEVQIVTSAGARAFEAERDSPELDLRDIF